jgi:hypothetical protein
MYKITICCEYNGEQLFSFKGNSIDTKKYRNIRRDIFKHLKTSIVSFMKNINILHKDFVEETPKEYRTVSVIKIEFVCNREITNKQFEWFIHYLKFIGFESYSDTTTIKFIEDGNIVFNYNFDDAVSWNVNKRNVIGLSKKYKTQLVV